MSLSFKTLQLTSNLFLSPLAGFTNLPFRLVIREIGGVGLCTTDLVNARSLLEKNRKALKLIETCPEDQPLAVQLFGTVAEEMRDAALVLEALGGEGQPWLVQRWSAFSVIVLTDVWLWTPWFALLLLAGLQSLPKEPFEAAAIDGTTAWRVFRYLTLPMLRPVIIVCIVIRSIDAFRTFDTVWALTGGGPARQTELLSVYAYEIAFVFLDFAKGSAAAIIGALIILVGGLALYRILDHVRKMS